MVVSSRAWMCVCLLSLVLLGSCKKATETPTAPTSDTTAPEVVGTNPANLESGIATSGEIRVTFSEAMDQATADGNVTLSTGTITSMTWDGDRVLVIAHSTWAEGAEITVSIGVGMLDLAGNALAATFAVKFWTESAVLVMHTSEPADGSTDVIRNSQIMLLFSQPMNLGSLASATTVMVGNDEFTFTLDDGEDNWVIMTINEVLPASSSVEVTIAGSAQDQSGNALGSTSRIGFDTGVEEDTTPPEIVGVDPANGSTLDPNAGFLRVTFSEPMNTDSFSPTAFNGALFLVLSETEISPVWSENNTVITVALPSQLPAGMPIDMTFEEFSDRNGVVQTTPFQWTARVAGTPDYYPVIDDAAFKFHVAESEGDLGSAVATCSWESEEFIGIESQPDGTFRRVEYDDFETKTSDEWEVFRRTASQLEWVGFYNEGDGGGATSITFSTPLPILKFPIAAGSVDVVSTATDAELGTLDIAWNCTIVGQVDLPAFTDEFNDGVVWKDAWKVVITFSVTSGGEDFFSSTETYWFAPTVGIVKWTTEEIRPQEQACESQQDGSWRNKERNLLF